MEFLGKGKGAAEGCAVDGALYRALAIGDLAGAWLIARPVIERPKKDKPSYLTAFNCGLCLYRLGEYEKALIELKLAEQSLGNPPDLDIAERKLFLQALSTVGRETALLPLDPEGGMPARYGLIRARWLMALSLESLGRRLEVAPLVRFLSQYQVEV